MAPLPRSAFAFLDHDGPIPFAHRGGASEAPENTLPAFQHAIDLGYRYLETDVHATADGVLLAFHDDVLDRVTDRTGVIADLPWSTVREARVDGEPIPLLEDVLGAWPEVRVNIDPKADTSVDPLIETIRRTGAVERVCIGAFDDVRIDRIRDAFGPTLCTGMGPDQVIDLLSVMEGEQREFRSPCVQIPMFDAKGRAFCTPELVDTAHDHGLVVHVWTIDERHEIEALLDMGVDGIMTDRPIVLLDLFRARGLWTG